MTEAVIVEAVRTAHGRRNGSLAHVHPVDLMADVLSALLERTGVDPREIDDVMLGCVTQMGDQSSNVARFATLAAGWPEHVPGVTINRACGSSQQALDFAAHAVMAGAAEVVVAGGVETMSRVPLGAARQSGQPYGPRVLERYDGFPFNQGLSAEMIAEKWALSRAELDAYSVESHAKAARAVADGAFDEQIIPIRLGNGTTFAEEECIRPDTSVEKMATLTPSFKLDGRIHAGNSSQISDGASALLVTTRARAKVLGLTPIARYVAGAVSGTDPVMMLTGPIDATAKLLDRTGLGIGDIGAFEVNEAFSPVPLAWLREVHADPERLNPNGGAIALGHPLGASGGTLTTRLVHHMRRNDVRYGLVTMCEGGGTANATLLELVA